MRIAVIGLGAVGAAALHHLAKQGIEAVGYEQFKVGHTRGSSHGASRIYRLTYADPTYTQMMTEALPLWQTLQAEAGEELMVPCGVLWIGAEEDTELNAIRATFTPISRFRARRTSSRQSVIPLGLRRPHTSTVFPRMVFSLASRSLSTGLANPMTPTRLPAPPTSATLRLSSKPSRGVSPTSAKRRFLLIPASIPAHLTSAF